MVFTGTYEYAIDSKNRLAIPAEVRAMVQASLAGSGKGKAAEQEAFWYVTIGEQNSLCLYTEAGFDKRAAELDLSVLDPDQVLEYERMMFSQASRVEVDSQGRIRLPDDLLKLSGLGTQVVLIGVKDHLEIRDREAWLAQVQAFLKEKAHLLVNPRKLTYKRPASEGPA